LVKQLVVVMMLVDSTHLPKKVTVEFPADVNRGLALLKDQWGAKNKTQVVLACVALVLKREGLLNS